MNKAIFGAHLRGLHDPRVRDSLSVPLVAKTLKDLYKQELASPRNPVSRIAKSIANRKTVKQIEARLNEGRANPALANHRAAVTLVDQLPAAAGKEENQLFLAALVRYMESPEGQLFMNAVGGLPSFLELIEIYEDIEREREDIATGKIAALHATTVSASVADTFFGVGRGRSTEVAEPVIEVSDKPLVAKAPEPVVDLDEINDIDIESMDEVAVAPELDVGDDLDVNKLGPVEANREIAGASLDDWILPDSTHVVERTPPETRRDRRDMKRLTEATGRPTWSEALDAAHAEAHEPGKKVDIDAIINKLQHDKSDTDRTTEREAPSRGLERDLRRPER